MSKYLGTNYYLLLTSFIRSIPSSTNSLTFFYKWSSYVGVYESDEEYISDINLLELLFEKVRNLCSRSPKNTKKNTYALKSVNVCKSNREVCLSIEILRFSGFLLYIYYNIYRNTFSLLCLIFENLSFSIIQIVWNTYSVGYLKKKCIGYSMILSFHTKHKTNSVKEI